MFTRAWRISSSFILTLGLTIGLAPAKAAYPERPITIVTPFPAGGATDTLARIIAEDMAKELKQSVIVENRPGAGTTIGAAYVARAKPDGYTVLLATNTTLVSSPYLHKKLSFDPDAFSPVGIIGLTPMVLLSSKQAKFSSLTELVKAAKENPGKLTIASFGVGTTSHLTAEHFQKTAGIQLLHVPFKGSTEALPQMINGEIDLFFDGVTTAIPPVNNGQVNAMNISSAKRMTTLPELPTIAEDGYPSFEMTAWFSLVTPPDTPAEINTVLSNSLKAVLSKEEIKNSMLKIGIEPADGSVAEIKDRIQRERPILKDLIESIGIAAQ